MQGKIFKKKEPETIRFVQGINCWILIVIAVCNVLFQLAQKGSDIFKYIGIAVFLAFLFFLDKDDYIYLSISFMSAISFATIFGVSIINIITAVYFYKAYVYDNKYIREKDRRKLPTLVVIPCVAWILLCLNFLFEWTSPVTGPLFYVAKQLLLLIYMVDSFRVCKNKGESRTKLFRMEVYYVVGVIISTLISLVINGVDFLGDSRTTLNSATGVNRFGVLLAFSMIYILLELLNTNNIKEWLVLNASAVFILYFCFATRSRNCIITVILSTCAVVIYGLFKEKSRRSIAGFLGLLMSAVIFVMIIGEDSALYNNVMGTIHRFMEPSEGDISNGRFSIWGNYLSAFLKDTRFFFLGSSRRDNYSDLEAHNIIIDILTQYGLIGFIIVVWAYFAVFKEIEKSIRRYNKNAVKLIGLLPFVMVFFMGMTSSLSLLTTNPTVNFCMGAATIFLFGDDNSNEIIDIIDSGRKNFFKKRFQLRPVHKSRSYAETRANALK